MKIQNHPMGYLLYCFHRDADITKRFTLVSCRKQSVRSCTSARMPSRNCTNQPFSRYLLHFNNHQVDRLNLFQTALRYVSIPTRLLPPCRTISPDESNKFNGGSSPWSIALSR